MSFELMWRERGSGDGDFSGPYGAGVDSGNNIYVADWENKRIQKFMRDGEFLAKFLLPQEPTTVTVDASGNVYVVSTDEDMMSGGVFKFNTKGQLLQTWRTEGWAAGIAVFGDILYLSNGILHRIERHSIDGVKLGQWGEWGSGDGQLKSPSGVAVDASGDVYVVEWTNERVQKFTGEGEFLQKWGTSGSGEGEFDSPWGIVLDSAGNVYVTEVGNNRVQKFSAEGKFILQWGKGRVSLIGREE